MTAKRKKRHKPRYSVSRKGMGGRKPRDDSGPGKPLYVRVTAAELAALRAGASADSYTAVHAWVRDVALLRARRLVAKIDAPTDDSSQ